MAEPSAIAAALRRVLQELDTAAKLLAEVYSIGLWAQSDDSSDNRRKRQGLRETDWAVSGALRALTSLGPQAAALPDEVKRLESELRELVRALEQLPDRVTDTMGTNFGLDADINTASGEVARLHASASRLLAEGPD